MSKSKDDKYIVQVDVHMKGKYEMGFDTEDKAVEVYDYISSTLNTNQPVVLKNVTLPNGEFALRSSVIASKIADLRMTTSDGESKGKGKGNGKENEENTVRFL